MTIIKYLPLSPEQAAETIALVEDGHSMCYIVQVLKTSSP